MAHSPRRDLIAGLSVAVVALPLALAFGVSSGVGAAAGITTAIVAGITAAVLGGSRVQVSGPTGAMTVVLIPIAAKYGAESVFAVGFFAGLILLVMTFSGAATAMRYIPASVIEGFTLGIALLIGLQQIPMALGIKSKGSSVVLSAIDAIRAWIANPAYPNIAITFFSVAFIFMMSRIRPTFPVSIISVALATCVTVYFKLDVATVGAIPSHLNWFGLPSFTNLKLGPLLIPALSVAGLAAIEGLLCASVADSMADLTPHNPHQELLGQTAANLIAPLFGGVPATAAIARTAVNVRSGAQSRLAAISHSVILLICVGLASSLVSKIPLSVLAGVLVATALRMVDLRKLKILIAETPHHLVIVPATALATLFLDLVEAVTIGVLVAFILSAFQDRAQRRASANEVDAIETAIGHALQPEDLK
jgi:SulP family sulfate permease